MRMQNKCIQMFHQLIFLLYLGAIQESYGSQNISNENIISVIKKNVSYNFVKFDEKTDHFVREVFPSWENDTFDIFETVKDPNGIAIRTLT